MKLKDIISSSKTYDSIVGIDASTNSIAFSHFNRKDGEWFLSRWGKINIYGSNIFEKCGDVVLKFSPLVKTLGPDLVVFESSAYVNNNAVMKQLSMIFGAAAGCASAIGTSVYDVPPITWQNHIGNSSLTRKEKEEFRLANPGISDSQVKVKLREERKARNILFVREKYGVILDDDDVADSICIGSYAIDTYGEKI